MSDDKKKDVDGLSGIETTGHEWDGLKELNNPLPKWWLFTWYVTIAWGVAYWVAMPAWPLISTHTKGLMDYSRREVVMQQVDEAKGKQQEFRDKLVATDLPDILKDEGLLHFASSAGKAAFGDNCAACHGQGAAGVDGLYPNLNDDEWLWGGTIDEIYTTIQYGIRNDHDDSHSGDMMAFGRDEILTGDEINLLVDYLQDISGQEAMDAEAKKLVSYTDEDGDLAGLFPENCAACHGDDAKGLPEMGAPNLTNNIWLYGGDEQSLRATLHNGRRGVMPSWVGRLDDATIRSLAVYVYSRGGGVAEEQN